MNPIYRRLPVPDRGLYGLDWLTSGRGSQHHSPISGEGRVGVTHHDSLDLLVRSESISLPNHSVGS